MADIKKIKNYLIIAFVFFAAALLYIQTANPVFKNNDSPETAAAAFTLGIGHPPGYPLHAISGKLFSLIPLANPAFRLNMYSVFLSLCIFLITFMILKKVLNRITKADESVSAALFSGMIMLSYMLWNQGTEAKGGIYMLNLLFLSLIIWRTVFILERFEIKELYFISFIYGLSLANHWPSMIILAPVIFFVYLLNIKKINFKHYIVLILLFITGLTPYIYMFIRAGVPAALNWGNPSNLENFIWVVSRKAYLGPVDASWAVFRYQIMEFLKLFTGNFGWLWVFAVPGVLAVNRYSKKLNAVLLSSALLIIFIVVFYNRTQEDVKWLIQIFIMPAEYIIGLFISAGIMYVLSAFKDKKLYRNLILCVTAAAAAVMICVNYSKNNHNDDYLSYDYGNNLLKTMEDGSLYVADGDYNLMPVYYIQEIEKRRTDVIFATASFMIFDWGINDFIKRYENIPMKPFYTERNILNIIENYKLKTNVYRSAFMPKLDPYMNGYTAVPKGLLVKLNPQKKTYSPALYQLYSYRSIFNQFAKESKNDYDLIGWYPVSMVNQANALLSDGYPAQAAELYIRALDFPIDKPEGNIYYNASLAYAQMADTDNEIKYLRLAALRGTSFSSAYERLGVLLYDRGFYKEAKKAFIEAKERGGNSPLLQKGIDSLSPLTEYQMNEAMLNKANQYISGNDFKRAEGLYKLLLENKFKRDIIYLNIGVFHYGTKNFDLAAENFKQSNNETPSVRAISYLALALKEKGKRLEAIKELETGIKLFPQDKELWGLYTKLKGESAQQ